MGLGLFESMDAEKSEARLASRKALVLSRERIEHRLGTFLGASRNETEFNARYELVEDDFTGIVRTTAAEFGQDPEPLIETLREAGKEHWIQDAVKKPGDLHRVTDTPEDENIPESKIENLEEHGDKNEKEKAQFAENVKKGSAEKCPLCKGTLTKVGDCPQCGENPGFGEKKKSKKDKKKDKGNKPPWLQDSADEGGKSDDEDGGDGEDLNFTASAVDAVPLAGRTAADADDDDSFDGKREKLPKGPGGDGPTGLAGPSPKMDKKRWTPKSVKELDVPSKRHPTEKMDAIKPLPRLNEGPPGDHDKIKGVGEQTTTRETLPTGKGLDDGGFAKGGEEFGPHTETFGKGDQTEPVTGDSALETVA